MVLAGSPVRAVRLGGLAGFPFFQLLPFVELAHDLAVKVQYGDGVQILRSFTEVRIDAGKQMPAGVHLVGHAVAAPGIPFLDQIAVAVDQLGRRAGNVRSQDHIAVPAFGRVIFDGSHRNDIRFRQGRPCAERCHAQPHHQRFQKPHCVSSLVYRFPKCLRHKRRVWLSATG